VSNEREVLIRSLIERNGPMGVNALSRQTGINLSTLQKWLERQSSFIKTEDRKWDLPENATAKAVKIENENFDAVMDSQLKGISTVAELLISNIKATVTIMNTQKPKAPSVAESQIPIDERLYKIQEDISLMPELIKKNSIKIPDDYKDLLNSIDWMQLHIDKGLLYFRDELSAHIADLILGNQDKLPDDTISTLEGYIK